MEVTLENQRSYPEVRIQAWKQRCQSEVRVEAEVRRSYHFKVRDQILR